MEVSTEISQKIRSAIKAKLMELGAYVDDELPDYIMVMVANKRSRSQMNKDLGLFLGANTSSFTEWLHSLLGKLQTIKSDFDKSADKQGKGGKLKAVRDKQKGEKQIDGLHSTREENVHSLEACSEKTQPDSGSDGGIKYKQTSDNKDTSNSSAKLSLQSENDDSVQLDILTDTSATDGVSEGVAMDTEAENARPLGLDTQISSASQSPGHGQSCSVNRKRKLTSELADVSKESEVFHPYIPAFANTTSELTADKSSSLLMTRNTDEEASEESTHDHSTEPPQHDGQPPQKVIRLTEPVQLEDIKLALAEVLEKSTIQNDDIAHFSRMLESSLRKLRPQDLSLAKMRIQQILYEFETVAFQEENLGGNQQNVNKAKQTSCLRNDLKFNSSGKYSRSLVADSGSEGVRNLLEDKLNSSTSSQTTDPCLLQKAVNDNSDHLVDNAGIFQPKINSGNLDNHLTATREYSSSNTRVNSEPRESGVEKVVFHSNTVNSQKSATEASGCASKIYDIVVKFGDKESAAGKLPDESPQSPGPLGKAGIGSPSSIHSCPLSSNLSLRIKRNVSSASRESTVSPIDLPSKPGSSHTFRNKQTSAKKKILPSILVDSIHTRKRSETSETASVLRQNLSKDKSPRPIDSTKQDIQDSPKMYGPEALKVMAKNLRITVINKRAVKSPQESSSDDSEDEEDDDSTDNDDEEEEEGAKVNNSSITKVKGAAPQKKTISDHSSA